MLIVGTSPTNPLPSKRRADFLDLLALANRARESGNWPVKHTNVSGRCCVDMDECRSWAEGVKPDLGRADLKDEVLRLERHALDVLRQRGLQVDSSRVSISRSGNDADRRQLLFYATQIESSSKTTAEEKSAAQTLQELPELWDEIESKHPSRRSLAARLSVLQERRLEETRQKLEKTRPDVERGRKSKKDRTQGADVTNEKYNNAREFAERYAKREYDNGARQRPGEMARDILAIITENLIQVGLKKPPAQRTVKNWIYKFAPDELKVKSGAPSHKT